MNYALDLSHRAWTHVRGEVAFIGTWLKGADGHRPCMVLIRSGEEFSELTVPCIVRLDTAWIWSEEIGDPREAARVAYEFCRYLRLGDHPQKVRWLATKIVDLVGDLIAMKPYEPPAGAGTVIADMLVTNVATGKSVEAQILDV